MFSVLALMWTVPASHAFCGTYVGQAGAGLYNQASQVVMVRQGLRTTLTLANDFEGDLEDFVLVVPVPLVLAEEDVDVVDPEIIGHGPSQTKPGTRSTAAAAPDQTATRRVATRSVRTQLASRRSGKIPSHRKRTAARIATREAAASASCAGPAPGA